MLQLRIPKTESNISIEVKIRKYKKHPPIEMLPEEKFYFIDMISLYKTNIIKRISIAKPMFCMTI